MKLTKQQALTFVKWGKHYQVTGDHYSKDDREAMKLLQQELSDQAIKGE